MIEQFVEDINMLGLAGLWHNFDKVDFEEVDTFEDKEIDTFEVEEEHLR